MNILEELGIPITSGGYGTIVADPPWSFSDKGSRAAPDWKEAPVYSTMSPEEIFGLPVVDLAAPRSHLYLWTTDSHVKLALNVMEEWGFAHKKVIVWVKRRCPTAPLSGEIQVLRGPLQIGMGHYYRTVKEICLFGTRGKQPGLCHDLPDVIEQPRSQHSRKPDQLLEWAERMSPGPRIELFARRSREGWEAWGDQFPGHDPYLRILAEKKKSRMEERKGLKDRRIRRREKVLAQREEMIEGIAKWPCRCALCDQQICAGDLLRYLPDASLHLCAGCFVDEQTAACEGAPF